MKIKIPNSKLLIFISVLFFGILGVTAKALAANCFPGNLYVDYENGSDLNDGTSADMAWKHSPGDENANERSNCNLIPGNTVNFKGGIKYRGKIEINGSGTYEHPVTFKGDAWGTGKAILTGAEAFTAEWTQCGSAASCWDNPNYSHIYTASIPSGKEWYHRLFQDGEFLWFSQAPDTTRPIAWEKVSEWYNISLGSETKSMTISTITDPDVFNQTSPSYWNGAYIAALHQGNAISVMPIVSFDPDTHTVTFAVMSAEPYADRDNKYLIFNHPASISKAGEYAFSADGKIYLWTNDGSPPATADLEMGNRIVVINSVDKSNIVLDGLIITGTYGEPHPSNSFGGMGIYLAKSGSGGDIAKINNVEARYLSGLSNTGVIFSGNTNTTVSNCNIHDLYSNRAIHVVGAGAIINNNTIARLSYSGIACYGCDNGLISGNSVTDLTSAHGNGISVYSGSDNITVEKNYVTDSASMLTWELGSNLTIKNNIFDGANIGGVFQNGKEMTGYVRIINNLFIRRDILSSEPTTGGILRMADGGNCSYIIKNNVIDGGGSGNDGDDVRENNIYVSRGWWQNSRYGWALGPGESDETSLSLLVADAENGNYAPLTKLIDQGVGVSEHGVTDDYIGTHRPQGSAWDIGAYEYQSGSDTTAPSAPGGLSVR